MVAPTGIDPVTFRFSVVRRMILLSAFRSQTLVLLMFLVMLVHPILIRCLSFVGKMWANMDVFILAKFVNFGQIFDDLRQ